MKKSLFSLFAFALLCSLPLISIAQPDPGDDPDVPIDGGLSLLVAAGVGYAVKKGYTMRKKKEVSAADKL